MFITGLVVLGITLLLLIFVLRAKSQFVRFLILCGILTCLVISLFCSYKLGIAAGVFH